MKRYLVTGGAGFIGSHLCDALVAQGHAVRILDDLSNGDVGNLPGSTELVVGDVCSGGDLRRALDGVDGVFHLAATCPTSRSGEASLTTHRINLGGIVELFEVLRERPVPVVYASSAAVYGDNASVPLGEGELPRPLTAFAADKLGCELHARVASLVHRVPTVGMRLFEVYGPRQHPEGRFGGVLPVLMNQLLNGLPMTVHGDGQQSRDFVYVEDAVRFLCAAMAACVDGAQLFNVCTGRSTTILQLARTLACVAAESPRIERLSCRTGGVRMLLGDPRRARRRLQVEATVSLADGLRRTLDELRSRQQSAAA